MLAQEDHHLWLTHALYVLQMEDPHLLTNKVEMLYEEMEGNILLKNETMEIYLG